MNEEIRLLVEEGIAEQFPQFNVSVGSARVIEEQGIAVYDLTFSETATHDLQKNLLVVDEILLHCEADLTQLIQGPPPVDKIVVRRPQLWVTRLPDGSWNLESLWPLPECHQPQTNVVIEDAQIAVSDQTSAGLPPLMFRDVNFTIRNQVQSTGAAISPLEIRGTLAGPQLREIQVQAVYHPGEQAVQLQTDFEEVAITEDALAWLTAQLGHELRETTLAGKATGKVSFEHQLTDERSPQLEANVALSQCRLEDRRLPYPIDKFSCQITCQNQLLKVEAARGQCGPASFALQLERQGWSPTAPVAAAIHLVNVPLNKSLYGSMPPLLRTEWDKYEPTGTVEAHLQATFDGVQWHPQAELRGEELSFTSDKFPYRVNNGSGTMRYRGASRAKPAILDVNLTAHAGGQPVTFVGQVFNPQPEARGWIEINGSKLEIETRMIAALPETPRKVIESLHPRGNFNVQWRLERRQLGQEPHTQLRLELINCRMKYDKFPYPLSGIHGLVLERDKQWTFQDLSSRGTGSVQCQGSLDTNPTERPLALRFSGQHIPLDDDLRSALPPRVQQAWQELRPRGNVDLTAEVFHATGYENPSISVNVHPLPEATSIHPQFFPYVLEQLEGTVHYKDGQVLLTEMRAEHGRSSFRSNGNGQFADDGGWEFALDGLTADRITANRDLMVALPPKLQRVIDQIDPTGYFRLENTLLHFTQSADSQIPIQVEWDMQLDCHQSDLQVGVKLENVHGRIRLEGSSQGWQTETKGEMSIDTATFEDVQFTQIQGPLWIDETQCLFGEWATKKQGRNPRRVTANVYGGTLVADGWVNYESVPRYAAVAALRGASLRRLMTEQFGGQQDYHGKVAANLTLEGRGTSMHNLLGKGDVKITEANIYKIPLLVGMLKVLRNATPNTTAFDQCDMKFAIEGRHIILDQLDFLGDAVSLFGRGYTNFDQDLNLQFHGVVGKNEFRIPFVKNFVDQVGKQTLQMYVDGTLSNPQIHTQAFPGINQLIQQIQTDLESVDGTAIASPRRAERSYPTLPQWGRR